MIQMNNRAKNNENEKAEIHKVANWYAEIRRVIRQAALMLTT